VLTNVHHPPLPEISDFISRQFPRYLIWAAMWAGFVGAVGYLMDSEEEATYHVRTIEVTPEGARSLNCFSGLLFFPVARQREEGRARGDGKARDMARPR